MGPEGTAVTIGRMLRDRNVILALSIVLGVAWNGPAPYLRGLVLPALAAVMTLSMMDVSRGTFGSVRSVIPAALVGIGMNYVVAVPVIMGLTALLIRDEAFRTGFVLVAAVPPAVAIVPFALLLRGDVNLALMGTIGGYLAALGLMPLIALAYLGGDLIDPMKLVLVIVELILAPLVVSRMLAAAGLSRRLERIRGAVVNWSFFLVSYVIIALNRDLLLSDPSALVPIGIISVASMMLLGAAIRLAGRLLRLDQGTVVSLILLGTLKNYGLSGGLALMLFDRQTAMPSTVGSVVMVVYFLLLGLWRKRA